MGEFSVWDEEGNTPLLRLCWEVIKPRSITQPAGYSNVSIFFTPANYIAVGAAQVSWDPLPGVGCWENALQQGPLLEGLYQQLHLSNSRTLNVEGL